LKITKVTRTVNLVILFYKFESNLLYATSCLKN